MVLLQFSMPTLAKSVNPGVCVDSDDVIDTAALVADWEIRNFRYLQGVLALF